jgi:hypothetical protein
VCVCVCVFNEYTMYVATGNCYLDCYNCGDKGHLGKNCPKKETRCRKCHQVGYYANVCAADLRDVKRKSPSCADVNKPNGKRRKRNSVSFICLDSICCGYVNLLFRLPIVL